MKQPFFDDLILLIANDFLEINDVQNCLFDVGNIYLRHLIKNERIWFAKKVLEAYENRIGFEDTPFYETDDCAKVWYACNATGNVFHGDGYRLKKDSLVPSIIYSCPYECKMFWGFWMCISEDYVSNSDMTIDFDVRIDFNQRSYWSSLPYRVHNDGSMNFTDKILNMDHVELITKDKHNYSIERDIHLFE